jgi:undecaprenyl-diphosphatase
MAKLGDIKHIKKPQVYFTAGVIALFTGFALFTLAFVGLSDEVREMKTLPFDTAVLNFVHGQSNYFLDIFMPVATDIGGVVGVVAITLIMTALFVYKNERRRALMLSITVAGAAGINLILKSVFERARPDLWETLVREPGFSFPSGHAMASAALGAAIVVALWDSRWRWWAFTTATFYIVFVGFSRLYLGVHYPTDIMAGWLVSGAWVMAATLMFRSRLGNRVLRKLP